MRTFTSIIGNIMDFCFYKFELKNTNEKQQKKQHKVFCVKTKKKNVTPTGWVTSE